LHIIEVSDDGCGISPSSLPFIATRHATSKISSIDDIYTGTGLTMGFRGEALFSMACVSKELVVATKTEDDELATKMVFGKDGLPIQDQTEHFTRKVGTTVAVVNPYSSLPARLADLTRRIRNERTRIYKLIEAYGIFNVGVSFQLIDIGDNGIGTTILQTSPTSETLKETVSHLLTPSVLKTMNEVDISLDSLLERIYGENLFHWGIKGLLSVEPSTQQQQASTSTARKFENRIVQFYSINGRVVELPKVTEVLQKLWKAFGGKKKPRIILSFTLPNEAFDINLSPDKQTVLLTHEKELLTVIEEEVTKMWSNSASRLFGVSQTEQTQNRTEQGEGSHLEVDGDRDGDVSDGDYEEDGYRQMHKRRFAFVHDITKAKMQHDMDERQLQDDPEDPTGGGDLDRVASTRKAASDELVEEEPPNKRAKHVRDTMESENSTSLERSSDIDIVTLNAAAASQALKISDTERRQWIEIQSKFRRSSSSEPENKMILTESTLTTQHKTYEDPENSNQVSPDYIQIVSTENQSDENAASSLKQKSNPLQGGVSSSSRQLRLTDLKKFAFQSSSLNENAKKVHDSDRSESVQSTPTTSQPIDDRRRQVSLELSSPSPQTIVVSPIDHTDADKHEDDTEEVADLKQTAFHRNDSESPHEDTAPTDVSQQVVWSPFRSTEDVCQSCRVERMQMIRRRRELSSARRDIALASSNTARDHDAEQIDANVEGNDENDRSPNSIRMSKSSFRDGMRVIGQFNLGFILAICSQNQLWILDQHACDEKYNFEHLCKKTVIHEQPLIRALPLELSPAEEACVLDHMDIFNANGFRFVFDADAPIRHRLSLKALPHSGAVDGQKAVQFGPSDVTSLCSILMEGSSYDPGDGGTGVDGSGMYGNNAVRRHASSASRIGQSQCESRSENRTSRKETVDTILARLPKAIAMFASRACRTSIMIGTALSQREMNTVVKKMAELDMPFTCAHGRPTMNHVGDLSNILLKDERRAAEYIATPTITMIPLSQQTEDND
jgi:DNA mismatch repair protein PMS2